MRLRIVFMGTPDFAVESLKCLIEAGHDIVGVITAPDKHAGRGKKLKSSPVKQYAEQAGIATILQPTNLKSPEFLDELKTLKADLQIVVAFRMLPESVWSMPPMGTINLHASLLPDYRGAAPINWALINGEKTSGVTTFFIEKEIDTGNIILSEETEISENMDAGDLHDKLMFIGGKLLVKTIDLVGNGKYTAKPQSELMAGKTWNQAPKIFKEDCRINWELPAEKIKNFIRGLSPYPATWTEISNGKQEYSMKIFKAIFESESHNFAPSQIITDNKTYIKISLKNGLLSIKDLQLAGKKRMAVAEFLRGFQNMQEFQLKD